MQPVPLHKPPSARKDDVVDTLHGISVADPYRWLEDGQSAETREFVEQQNQAMRQVLDSVPQRGAIHRRLDQLLTTGAVGAPVVKSDRYFYQRRDGRSDQPVLVMKEGDDGVEHVILDPNVLSASGVVALDWWHPSEDGRLLAYGTSEGGTELSTLFVLDVDRAENLPTERIPYTRAASVAWLPDSLGFYYTRYPEPGSVAAGEEMYNRHVFFHQIGRNWRSDPEVFGDGRAREDWPQVDLSPGGRWLAVTVQQGWARSEVFLLDRERPERDFIPLFAGYDAMALPVFAGDRLVLHTNLDAPNWAAYEIDVRQPDREHWQLRIAEQADRVLDAIRPAAGVLVAHEIQRASSRLRVYSVDGALRSELELPSLGTITGIGGEFDGERVAVGFTSFTQPPIAYRVDPASGRWRVIAQGEAPPDLNVSHYVVRQEWYASRDGTRVSMFLMYRGDMPIGTDPRPAVLTGYGGFNVSRTPMFIAALPMWLDAGGVYALANLRGGGEYGEAWHRAGMLGNKQNVFDDFIAAGEWLVSQNITTPRQLAISGGSNGGLLVGAALTQRPELFKAVVCQVPLLDMLRYQNLRIARLWIAEYGSAEDATQFAWLYAYSPYHRVEDGVAYPATFLLTAEGDSRVDPMHARKMAARLQAATAGNAPILLRVETAAGHGQGKPRGKQLEEATDIWSFVFWQLGVPERE